MNADAHDDHSGDLPVLLVNDRQMISYMSDSRLDELVDTLKASAR